jgi:hypothetical protein
MLSTVILRQERDDDSSGKTCAAAAARHMRAATEFALRPASTIDKRFSLESVVRSGSLAGPAALGRVSDDD